MGTSTRLRAGRGLVHVALIILFGIHAGLTRLRA